MGLWNYGVVVMGCRIIEVDDECCLCRDYLLGGIEVVFRFTKVSSCINVVLMRGVRSCLRLLRMYV